MLPAMSDLNYYAVPPEQWRPPHRGGLIAWGVVLIIVGAFLSLSSLGTLVMIGLMGRFGPARLPVGTLLASGGFTGLLAVGLVWTGIGCCRGRRWVRPVVIALSSVSVGIGVVSILPSSMLMAGGMDAGMTASGGTPMPAGLVVMIVAVTLLFSALFWIGVPLWMALWFRRPSVEQSLVMTDPVRRWTDAAPIAVLAWAMACGWTAVTTVMVVGSGQWFWFARPADGWVNGLALAIGLGLAVAAVASWRRSAAGWALGVGLATVLAASAVTFLVAGDPTRFREQMAANLRFATAPPPATAPTTGVTTTTATVTVPTMLPPVARSFNPAVLPALHNVALVGFGLWVRRRIVAGPVPATAEAGG